MDVINIQFIDMHIDGKITILLACGHLSTIYLEGNVRDMHRVRRGQTSGRFGDLYIDIT